MEAQALFDSNTLACFMDKELVQKYKLALVKKNILMLIEVIDGRNLSSQPITYESKPIDVTIGSRTN